VSVKLVVVLWNHKIEKNGKGLKWRKKA